MGFKSFPLKKILNFSIGGEFMKIRKLVKKEVSKVSVEAR